jgi:hypothetical protein
METLEFTSYGIGAFAAAVAGLLKLYRIAYSRGYEDGKHCGFTEGLYRAAQREYRQRNRTPISV